MSTGAPRLLHGVRSSRRRMPRARMRARAGAISRLILRATARPGLLLHHSSLVAIEGHGVLDYPRPLPPPSPPTSRGCQGSRCETKRTSSAPELRGEEMGAGAEVGGRIGVGPQSQIAHTESSAESTLAHRTLASGTTRSLRFTIDRYSRGISA